MVMGRDRRRITMVLLGVSLGLTLSGCDYWPPALQTQIEQLQTEIQILNTEKAQLQAQVTDLSKSRQDLQFQLDELSRVNQEKSAIITSLQNQVQARQQKSLKPMGSHSSSKKKSAKDSASPSTKAPRAGHAPSKSFGIR